MAIRTNMSVGSKSRMNDQNMIRLEADNFKELFHENYIALCKYCIRFVRRAEIAEEIVQDQFIYIWNNRYSIDIHTTYKSYLYKAVKNKSIDYLRSRFAKQRFNNELEDIDQTLWEDPALKIEAEELKKMVGEAMQSLPEKCYTIFTLSRFGEMKNSEIADSLNISIKTVENQITIALRKLKAFLDKHWMLLVLLFSLVIKEK